MTLGALEAGGTKMVCAIGNECGKLFEKASFPTREPEASMLDIIGYFKSKNIDALGVGSFGPLNLDKNDPLFGSITTSPKLSWRDYPLRNNLQNALDVPVGIDTDVNAAALGEAEHGAGKGLSTVVYFTIGTGIGGGIYNEGSLYHGLVHPEMGHIFMRPHPEDPAPHGFCPYHDGCLEGMACGTAIEKRWGVSPRDLPINSMAWEIEADYIAQMCVTTIVMLSPKIIILGGGVMHQSHLFPRVRKRTIELLGGYVAHPAITQRIDSFIVAPGLGDNSGAVGALLLARDALIKA